MTAHIGSRPLLLIFLLAAAGLLGWHVLDELTNPPQLNFPNSGAAGEVSPLVVNTPVVEGHEGLPPLESFGGIMDRPLFSPTRRPPTGETVIVEEPRTELSVSLVGIIISSDEHIAIVSPNDGTGILRLYRGDEVQGWTLVSIEPDRVIFRRGDEEERVELNYERAPVRSERPRRPRQRENPNNREITQ